LEDGKLNSGFLKSLLDNPQTNQEEIEKQRDGVKELKEKLGKGDSAEARELLSVADYLVRRSVWILGGDGWAYDIGYGGLDHVLASGRDVNILCLDTEVYSNTGGQMSKATPVGAIAAFAAGGKPLVKKDLGLMAMSYGYVYVARIAMGANKLQTVRAMLEAESYNGPSLLIAYSHCINHGYDLRLGMEQQKRAVAAGLWNLVRFDPRLKEQGKNPLLLDSREPKIPVEDYMYNEIRFRSLKQINQEAADKYLKVAQEGAKERYLYYRYLADRA
jgi:pyruvate-ferredoxin/flavodoxin oxidoreductase